MQFWEQRRIEREEFIHVDGYHVLHPNQTPLTANAAKMPIVATNGFTTSTGQVTIQHF